MSDQDRGREVARFIAEDDHPLLECARTLLHAGRRGIADVGGMRFEVRSAFVVRGCALALAAADGELPAALRGSDLAGDVRVRSRNGRFGELEVSLAGWWRRVSSIEVLAEARPLLTHVPVWALIDPQQWIDRASLLELEVAAAVVRSIGPVPGAADSLCLRLDDREARRWLLA